MNTSSYNRATALAVISTTVSIVYFFLPEHDYIMFGYLLSQICLSSVTFVHHTQGVETFGDISLPFCALAILLSPCRILRRSLPGDSSIGGIKRKRGSKIRAMVDLLKAIFQR